MTRPALASLRKQSRTWPKDHPLSPCYVCGSGHAPLRSVGADSVAAARHHRQLARTAGGVAAASAGVLIRYVVTLALRVRCRGYLTSSHAAFPTFWGRTPDAYSTRSSLFESVLACLPHLRCVTWRVGSGLGFRGLLPEEQRLFGRVDAIWHASMARARATAPSLATA